MSGSRRLARTPQAESGAPGRHPPREGGGTGPLAVVALLNETRGHVPTMEPRR